MPYKRKSAELQTFALVGYIICTFDTIHYSWVSGKILGIFLLTR